MHVLIYNFFFFFYTLDLSRNTLSAACGIATVGVLQCSVETNTDFDEEVRSTMVLAFQGDTTRSSRILLLPVGF